MTRHAHLALVLMVSGGLAVPLGPTAAPAAAGVAAAPGVVLRAEPGDGVAAATVSLAPAAGAPQARSATDVALDTSPFSQVAVTWRGAPGEVEVRTHSGGGWSRWRELEPLHDGPTVGTEGNGRSGSDLLWVGESDGVQVRTTGAPPRDLSLVLQQPAASSGTTSRVAPPAAPKPSAKKRKGVPKPVMFSRNAWGAKAKWLNGSPTYNKKLKQVHIHHTATGNDYAKDDVPGLLRGMYRYHTKSLGWFDLGYNFVVDRFGRTWVGRSGGKGRMVRGAHTLGFNHNSTGIAVLGNFENEAVPKPAVTAVVRLAAWKLDKHDAPRAEGTVTATSKGSDLYPAGKKVRLPAIDGHRDTNQTACPGEELYDKLPRIRERVQQRIDRRGR